MAGIKWTEIKLQYQCWYIKDCDLAIVPKELAIE